MPRPMRDALAAEQFLRQPSLSGLVAEVQGHAAGARVDIGPEFRQIILCYGQPGVLRGHDHRGQALQEVREFNFACWPDAMPQCDRKKLRALMHRPEWVVISGCGMKAAQPTSGKWVRAGEPDFERLSRMDVLGEIT